MSYPQSFGKKLVNSPEELRACLQTAFDDENFGHDLDEEGVRENVDGLMELSIKEQYPSVVVWHFLASRNMTYTNTEHVTLKDFGL